MDEISLILGWLVLLAGLALFAFGVGLGAFGFTSRRKLLIPAFLLTIPGYMVMKFASTGRLFDIPSSAGFVNIDLVVGVLFSVIGLGVVITTLQTRHKEFIRPLLAGGLFFVGFMIIHLVQTDYQYPVSIVSLSVADGVELSPVGGLSGPKPYEPFMPIFIATGVGLSLFSILSGRR